MIVDERLVTFINSIFGFWLGGKFPNSHVSGNKAMRERGIGCVQSQDREAQKKGKFSIEALEKANEKKDN